MKGRQVPAAIAFGQARRHCPHDLAVSLALDGTIAAEYPDDGPVCVPPAEPETVRVGIVWREDLRTYSPFRIPLITPGREHADVHTQLGGPVHDVIDVLEI